MAGLLPFGSAPTPLATQTVPGKVTLAQLSSPTPTTLQSSFTVAAHTQVSAPIPITVGSGFGIIVGQDAGIVAGNP